jgi:hypothetical protein
MAAEFGTTYLTIPLDNGHTWGLHADEIILPGGSLDGMTPEEIGQAVLALARLTTHAHAFFQDTRTGSTLADFVAFVRRPPATTLPPRDPDAGLDTGTGRGFATKKRQAVWDKTQGRCWYCGIQTKRQAHEAALDGFCIEHQIPWSEGGTHHLTNLVPACRSCNARKGTKSLEAYRAWLARRTCPHFTEAHIAYLEQLKIPLPLDFPCYPQIRFWGEDHAPDAPREEGQ